MSAFQAPTGTHDILPPESARFAATVARFAALARTAGYGLLVSPMFEDAQVFRRGAGAATDLVQKQMYEFEDKAGRLLALRPEGTASVVRAFVQHHPPIPWKVWYATPAFRYERPQAGRHRQHHQLGVEAIGSADPDLDVEVIALGSSFLAALGLRGVRLKVNSMGDDACLPAYRDALTAYLESHEGELCPEHARRWSANPLRVLDCKDPACVALHAGAPRLGAALCRPCREHFGRVTEGLEALGIAWTRDELLVRGLDYYTRTTFEFSSPAIPAAQDVVLGGGRYDKLVAVLGGDPAPGIGFGCGIERVLLAAEADGLPGEDANAVDVFVVDLTDGAAARDLTAELRRTGVTAERAFDGRSAKAQLRLADRRGARLALIVGTDELAAGTVTLRVLRGEEAGHQEPVARGDVVAALRRWVS
ncbi:MAG TPA: histidine--tRNA ligase [Acidimicrobiales bacterium]|nr:histidine--tRNA ligase [Acidimicrobiales bacterium]